MKIKKLVVATALLAAVGMVATAVVLYSSPDLRWRAVLVRDMALGRIDGITWGELLPKLRPGSGFYLEPASRTRNVYSAIVNPFTSDADIASGAEAFRGNCVTCHGAGARGGSAPSLVTGTFAHGASDWALFRNITKGIDGTQMLAMPVGELEAWQIIAYLRDLAAGDDVVASAPQTPPTRPVTAERLLQARSEAANWLTYSGAYDSQRFSLLNQINRDSVERLTVAWIRQLDTYDSLVEVTPLVNDGVMYITEPPNTVHALDAATGSVYWTYNHPVPNDLVLCCGRVNRGVALAGDLVIMGTLDARLVALDAATGRLVWSTVVDDYRSGISITLAPLTVGDTVIVGVAGGEFGIRGYLDSYDLENGARLWRTHTIPAPGEPGHDTWTGDTWRTGGAPTWLTGSYDPVLNLLYWGVGNPGPLYHADYRPGDNLYSNSVVALDPADGELKWHFQFTPNDEHDWDSNQIPVLVDREAEGVTRHWMLWANRNAFFYVLDRARGEFQHGRAFAKQNWADGLTEEGRPRRRPETRVTVEGTVTYPSPTGAVNWQSPAYSPETGLMYVQAFDFGQIVYKQADPPEYEEGEPFIGSGHQYIPSDSKLEPFVRAIDPSTGTVVWQHAQPVRAEWWKTGGLVTTSGGIVFGGDDTRLFVVDAANGRLLWELDVGGRVNASPMTYAVDGRQYLAMAAGRSLIALALSPVAADKPTEH